jgi:hypothetical protein
MIAQSDVPLRPGTKSGAQHESPHASPRGLRVTYRPNPRFASRPARIFGGAGKPLVSSVKFDFLTAGPRPRAGEASNHRFAATMVFRSLPTA